MKKEIREHRKAELERISEIVKESIEYVKIVDAENKENSKFDECALKLDTIAPEQPLMQLSRKLADTLYESYQDEQKRDCGFLLLQWVSECFWGKVTENHIPLVKQTWDILNKSYHTCKDSALYYGDDDGKIWCEVSEEEKCKIIIDVSYCRCADDSTIIYILKERPEYNELKIVTAWKKQKKNKHFKLKDSPFDCRDIEEPSLKTFRDYDFNLGGVYDKWHVLKYDTIHRNVDNAHNNSQRIIFALDNLTRLRQVAQNTI